MSNNSDYIALSNSPISNGNEGRNNSPYFNRNHSQNYAPRIGGFRNNHSPYSPYNRGQGRKSFNNRPQFDKPHDISSYYHPSMMQDPWEKLENLLKKQSENGLANDSSSSSMNLSTFSTDGSPNNSQSGTSASSFCE